jgi:hypothetical protein
MKSTFAVTALATLAGCAFAMPAALNRREGRNPAEYLGAGANPSLAHKNTTGGMNPNSSLFVKNPTYQTFSDFDFQR